MPVRDPANNSRYAGNPTETTQDVADPELAFGSVKLLPQQPDLAGYRTINHRLQFRSAWIGDEGASRGGAGGRLDRNGVWRRKNF